MLSTGIQAAMMDVNINTSIHRQLFMVQAQAWHTSRAHERAEHNASVIEKCVSITVATKLLTPVVKIPALGGSIIITPNHYHLLTYGLKVGSLVFNGTVSTNTLYHTTDVQLSFKGRTNKHNNTNKQHILQTLQPGLCVDVSSKTSVSSHSLGKLVSELVGVLRHFQHKQAISCHRSRKCIT